jgi:glycosyltransferase involved in cell wall biosynthesis
MPRITTVIPTYRRPALLDRAIRSVLNQGCGDFEIQVYDNASGDETASVVGAIAARDGRVKYYCHEHDIGLIENFAFGISRVRTPWFNLLSDDDILLPGFFAAALRDLENHPKAMCFVGGLAEADLNGRVLRLPFESWRTGEFEPRETLAAMGQAATATWTSMLFRSELIAAVGNLDLKFGYAADLEFELRVFNRFPIAVSNWPCAVFFFSPLSASANWSVPELGASMIAMLANLEGAGNGVGSARYKELTARFRAIIFLKALAVACEGRIDEARAAVTILAEDFGARRAATLVRLICNRSIAGTLARSGLRTARRLIQNHSRKSRAIRYRDLNGLIARSLSDLGVQTPPFAGLQASASQSETVATSR